MLVNMIMKKVIEIYLKRKLILPFSGLGKLHRHDLHYERDPESFPETKMKVFRAHPFPFAKSIAPTSRSSILWIGNYACAVTTALRSRYCRVDLSDQGLCKLHVRTECVRDGNRESYRRLPNSETTLQITRMRARLMRIFERVRSF